MPSVRVWHPPAPAIVKIPLLIVLYFHYFDIIRRMPTSKAIEVHFHAFSKPASGSVGYGSPQANPQKKLPGTAVGEGWAGYSSPQVNKQPQKKLPGTAVGAPPPPISYRSFIFTQNPR